jgi:hypothetical protein
MRSVIPSVTQTLPTRGIAGDDGEALGPGRRDADVEAGQFRVGKTEAGGARFERGDAFVRESFAHWDSPSG